MSEAILKSLRETLKGHIQASPGTPQFKAQCIQKLETLSRAQLEDLLAKTAQESAQALQRAQSELETVRAERHVANTLADRECGGPQRRQEAQQALIDKDVATFAAACKAKRTVSVNQANFQLLVEAIGENFTQQQAEEFIETNNSLMSVPSRHEMFSWDQEDAKERKAAEAQRVTYLKNMDSESLRAEVKAAGQQIATQQQQAFVQQQMQAMEEKCAGQFPDIPSHNSLGDELSSSYFIKLSNSPYGSEPYLLFKKFIRKHGFANLTARIQGVR